MTDPIIYVRFLDHGENTDGPVVTEVVGFLSAETDDAMAIDVWRGQGSSDCAGATRFHIVKSTILFRADLYPTCESCRYEQTPMHPCEGCLIGPTSKWEASK